MPPSLAAVRDFLSPPGYPGTRLTAARLANLYLARLEYARGAVRPRSYPIKLTIEPTNVCNLRCPACFTGVGDVGRVRSMMSLDLFRTLLRELGDYLFELELCNWGEPLLHKDIHVMIGEATARGISTLLSTNFSLPFDAVRAEQLVASGLSVLGVSIDGARQETYAKYRVRGRLDTVLDNCRLVQEAKRRLGSERPQLYWGFHVFPHNTDDVEAAKAMAAELGMGIAIEKGWVVGEEWGRDSPYQYFRDPTPSRCEFLWMRAVVNNDGGVASCCGSFFREDDMGTIDPSTGGRRPFRAVWMGERFQTARQFYAARVAASEAERSHICYDCPATVTWERWTRHAAAGGTRDTFDPGFRTNDGFNYFWSRRQLHAGAEKSLRQAEPSR
jgi:MoaA/NifB/PqqE/SkfB family radical SAM enzyme